MPLKAGPTARAEATTQSGPIQKYRHLEGAGDVVPAVDSCFIPFDEVLETHYRNKNAVALMDLGDKYARRFDYEKVEKSYLKALSLPGQEDHLRLVKVYLESGQPARAASISRAR